MVLAFFTGSDPSAGRHSTKCTSTRQRRRCFKNLNPSPTPEDAPSISPGMSSMTKLRPMEVLTTPKEGTMVVKG